MGSAREVSLCVRVHMVGLGNQFRFTTQPRLHSDALQLPHIVLAFIRLLPLLQEDLCGELLFGFFLSRLVLLTFGFAHRRLFVDGHRRLFVNLLPRCSHDHAAM